MEQLNDCSVPLFIKNINARTAQGFKSGNMKHVSIFCSVLLLCAIFFSCGDGVNSKESYVKSFDEFVQANEKTENVSQKDMDKNSAKFDKFVGEYYQKYGSQLTEEEKAQIEALKLRYAKAVVVQKAKLVGGAVEDAANKATDAVDNASDKANEAINQADQAVQDVNAKAEAVKNQVKDTKDQAVSLKDQTKQAVKDTKNGAKDVANKTKDSAKKLSNDAKNLLK